MPAARMAMHVGHFETEQGQIPFIDLRVVHATLRPTAQKERDSFARYAGARTPTPDQARWIRAFQAGCQKDRVIPVVCTQRASVRCHVKTDACDLIVGTDGMPGWTTCTGPAGVPAHVGTSLQELTRRSGGVLVSFGDHELAPPMFWVPRVVFTQAPMAAPAENPRPIPARPTAPVPPAIEGASKVVTGTATKKSRGRFPSALATFLRDLELEGKSVHTLRAYRHDLGRFAKAHPELKVVTAPQIRAHLRALQDGGASASTISRALATLKAFYRSLTESEVIARNPAEPVRFPRTPLSRPTNVLTVEEIDRLLDAVLPGHPQTARDRAILFLLYNTGIRAGELVALDRKDVFLKLRGEGELAVVGKGQRSRWIPLNRPVQNILQDYLKLRGEHDGPLFLSRVGHRYSARGLYKLVTSYLKRAGIPKTGVHLLRHTFASHALQADPNIRAIQELLGHRSILTTQRYTHLTREDLKRQVANLPGNRFR